MIIVLEAPGHASVSFTRRIFVVRRMRWPPSTPLDRGDGVWERRPFGCSVPPGPHAFLLVDEVRTTGPDLRNASYPRI